MFTIGEMVAWLIIGALAGTLAGRLVTFSKKGLGRWTNLAVGMGGALVGGLVRKLLGVDFGLGEVTLTFEDLIAAFIGSLVLIVGIWLYRKLKGKPHSEDE
jgi:uncharacterized membrane protein YeaQ/YmgE (transglycosylase-associated protein family)